jgi:hypothetical protein
VAPRKLLLLAAGLLVVAGCFGPLSPPSPPPPPPSAPEPPPRATQVCGQSFTSASAYQTSFYNLGQTDTGWVTADGFAPVALPDGRTAWWMGDTITGSAQPDNSVANAGIVRNTLVQQSGSCLTPTLGDPDMINGTSGRFYWPGAAVIEDSTMAVFSYKVEPASGQPGFNWRVLGTAVTRFALPSLQQLGPPTDLPSNPTPQDPYGGDPVPWGIHSFRDPADGKVYLYGTTRREGPFPYDDAWLARAPFAQVTDQSAWEFFTNPVLPTSPSWSNSFADAKPMTFTKNALPDGSPIAQLNVVPYGSRYLAGAFEADVFQDQQGRSFVRAWVADTPQGPWQMVVDGNGKPRDIATFQHRTSEQMAYGARIVQLSGGAGWTVVYGVNDPVNWQDDFTLYRGEFAAPNGLPAP